MAPVFLKRACWLVILVVFNAGCTHAIFQPHKKHYLDPADHDVTYENVFFNSSNNIRLHGWWLPAEDNNAKATVLFLHGNAGNISTHIANAYWMTKRSFNVFLFDYRGYGYSGGQPGLSGIMDDISSALQYSYKKNRNQKVVVIGQSLGASLGIYAVAKDANKDKVLAFVGVSGFGDYHEITQDVLSNWWLTWAIQWPLSFVVDNDYRPLDYIGNISPIPLAIMHSQADEIIPYYHGKLLYKAAKEPKAFIGMTGLHNSTFTIEENRNKLNNFLLRFVK
jgi:uncharacterized protein